MSLYYLILWNQVDILQKHFKEDHVLMRLWTRFYGIGYSHFLTSVRFTAVCWSSIRSIFIVFFFWKNPDETHHSFVKHPPPPPHSYRIKEYLCSFPHHLNPPSRGKIYPLSPSFLRKSSRDKRQKKIPPFPKKLGTYMWPPCTFKWGAGVKHSIP